VNVYATSGPLVLTEGGTLWLRGDDEADVFLGPVDGAWVPAGMEGRRAYLEGVWRDGQWDGKAEALRDYYRGVMR
jgi:hypothetical protein